MIAKIHKEAEEQEEKNSHNQSNSISTHKMANIPPEQPIVNTTANVQENVEHQQQQNQNDDVILWKIILQLILFYACTIFIAYCARFEFESIQDDF